MRAFVCESSLHAKRRTHTQARNKLRPKNYPNKQLRLVVCVCVTHMCANANAYTPSGISSIGALECSSVCTLFVILFQFDYVAQN